MNSHLILTDNDVRALIDYRAAVAQMEDALREAAAGMLVAPPRFSLDTKLGSLVFTAGAATGSTHALGFRVYDTFAGSSTDTAQIVAVFDPDRGGLVGIIIGGLIGALRTGALGGVALRFLARADSEVLAVVGSGFQARSQLQAALAVLPFRRVLISSRTAASAHQLEDQILQHHQVECVVTDSTREAVESADVVICATSSTTPVLESDWVNPGTHVTTVGPKLRGAQELPSDFGERCAVVTTDSMAQIESYGQFFLDSGPVPFGLDQIVAGRRPGRTEADGITLYCSVGLAGTEVVLASEVLRRAAVQQGAAAGGQQLVSTEVW